MSYLPNLPPITILDVATQQSAIQRCLAAAAHHRQWAVWALNPMQLTAHQQPTPAMLAEAESHKAKALQWIEAARAIRELNHVV